MECPCSEDSQEGRPWPNSTVFKNGMCTHIVGTAADILWCLWPCFFQALSQPCFCLPSPRGCTLLLLLSVSSQYLGTVRSVTVPTAAADAAEKLGLWNTLKNKSELYSYQTDISLLSAFCPEQESLCSDLLWTECSWDSRGPPHPSFTSGCFLSHQIWIYRWFEFLA